MHMTDADRQEYFEFLDDLRESGVTNMYGAGTFLEDEFIELGRKDAGEVLTEWMDTFTERHPCP
jgi:hypothetical protein